MIERIRQLPGWVLALLLIILSALCALASDIYIALGLALGTLGLVWIGAQILVRRSSERDSDGDFRTYSITCPRCTWKGPVSRASSEIVNGRREVSCPKCDRTLEAT